MLSTERFESLFRRTYLNIEAPFLCTGESCVMASNIETSGGLVSCKNEKDALSVSVENLDDVAASASLRLLETKLFVDGFEIEDLLFVRRWAWSVEVPTSTPFIGLFKCFQLWSKLLHTSSLENLMASLNGTTSEPLTPSLWATPVFRDESFESRSSLREFYANSHKRCGMYGFSSSLFPFWELLDVSNLTWKEAISARKSISLVKSFLQTPSYHCL